MTGLRDVLVVGGGPAGLAAAAALASRGLDVLVLERRSGPVDKACGEGLLPKAVAALEELRACAHLAPADVAPLRALRWLGDDGTCAEARLPDPGGLGVRRIALREALARRAREAGAELRDGVAVLAHRREPERIVVETENGSAAARALVAADGLASPIRWREGLEGAAPGPPRYGVRRHLAMAPWGEAVEVHFGERVEAYVTPVGLGRVGLAFLFERGVDASFERLLARFPRIAERIGRAPFENRPAGAGPLARSARARVADRLVLAGDAAGYLDAITGEGLALAFEGALALGRILPEALLRGADRHSLLPYERYLVAAWKRYAGVTRLVLGMARRPRLRREVLSRLARHPRLFGALVSWAVG